MKKYARSEMHLEDVFESICDRLQDYAELTNEDGTKEVVRRIGMDGTRLSTKDYNLNKDIGKRLRYQCEDFLEDNVEAVMSVLQRDNLDDYEKIICGEDTGVCSDEQLSRPITELPEAKHEEPGPSETEDEEDGDEVDTEEETEEELSPEQESTNADTNEKEEL